MSHQKISFHQGSNYMMQQDVQQQRGADGYHVRVTTTEWQPQPVPRYPNLNPFFSNDAPEDFYESNRHEAPRYFYDSNRYEAPRDFFGGNRYGEQVPAKHTEKVHESNRYDAPIDFFGSNRYGEQVPANHTEKVHVKKHVQFAQPNQGKKHVQFAQPNQGKHQTPNSREDVNMEADDFIKRKHKMMSTN